MKIHEFLQSLRTIKDKFEWQINANGDIRAYNTEGECFCPLTALYYECTKSWVPPHHVDTAQEWLEIEIPDAAVIIAAADLDRASQCWSVPDAAIVLRKQMKEILGFE